MTDRLLDSFNEIRMNKICKLPVISVYKSPADYKNKYVARLFDSLPVPKPLNYVIVKNSLQEVRKGIPQHMTKLKRCDGDDPTIVENYI